MKISTITCHDCYNLGASLQAFALQKYLEGLGHTVTIIHYKPDYLSGHYKLWTVSNSKFDKPAIKYLYLLAKLPGRLLRLRRKKIFDVFTEKYLSLTERYNSYNELKDNAPSADCYIAGSDQIWNTSFKNGRDPAFYLDFGSPKIKRISYAASFATPSIASGWENFVKIELQHINHVSIRERISLPLLNSLGRSDGVAVCDPVFLLNKDQWTLYSKLSQFANDDKYILVYLTNKSVVLENIAKEMSHITGWKIFVIGQFRTTFANRHFVNAGPFDFIRLISRAQYVISNSFHATAFSLIFERDFCVINCPENINDRMKSLLEDFGLSQRLVSDFDKQLLSHINYDEVNLTKSRLVDASKNWLLAAIDS